MFSEEVNQKIAAWEAELQAITHNSRVKLQPIIIRDETEKISLDDITEVCAHATGITAEDIKGKSRKTEVMVGRHMLYWFAFHKNIASKTKIGHYLGSRDHTTVIAGIRTVSDMLSTGNLLYTEAFTRVEFYLGKLHETLGVGHVNG